MKMIQNCTKFTRSNFENDETHDLGRDCEFL